MGFTSFLKWSWINKLCVINIFLDYCLVSIVNIYGKVTDVTVILSNSLWDKTSYLANRCYINLERYESGNHGIRVWKETLFYGTGDYAYCYAMFSSVVLFWLIIISEALTSTNHSQQLKVGFPAKNYYIVWLDLYRFSIRL